MKENKKNRDSEEKEKEELIEEEIKEDQKESEDTFVFSDETEGSGSIDTKVEKSELGKKEVEENKKIMKIEEKWINEINDKSQTYDGEGFVLRKKSKEKEDIRAIVAVIGISALITIMYVYFGRAMEGLFITIVYSLIGNFYCKWRINNKKGNMDINRGLKKGFLIWLFTGLIPLFSIFLLIGTCGLLYM